MHICAAIKTRTSIRAFLQKPVPRKTLNALFDTARWAPSGGNLQPWRVDVVSGAARDQLVEQVKAALQANPFADESEIAVYPKSLHEPFRTRRFEMGEAMYETLNIPREDKAARLAHLARNFEFFDAPVGIFFSLDRRFDKGQWAHLGMFMQSLALAAHEAGLATCMQEAWATRAKTVARFLNLPDDHQLYCGMALGYGDPDAPVNKLRTNRINIEDFVVYHDGQETP